MKLRSTAVVVLAALLLAATPAAAGTKTVPASAFRPVMNLDPAKVVVFSTPITVGVYGSANPSDAIPFTAQVSLPVGARITRLRYLFENTQGHGQRMKLTSYVWGAGEAVDRASLDTSGAASGVTEIATTAITGPRVKSGETYVLVVYLAAGSYCYGVKIDYQP